MLTGPSPPVQDPSLKISPTTITIIGMLHHAKICLLDRLSPLRRPIPQSYFDRMPIVFALAASHHSSLLVATEVVNQMNKGGSDVSVDVNIPFIAVGNAS
jgi:hypothetical protein